MKILGLHGWRTNKDVLTFQLGGLTHAFKKTAGGGATAEPVEIECLNAPREASGPPYPEVARFFGEDEAYYEWWDTEKLDDGTRICHGMDDAVDFVLEHIRTHGPYDALLGFSQGGALISYIQARVEENLELVPAHLRWRCAIFVASVPVADRDRYPKYFDDEAAAARRGTLCPSLHLIGAQDSFKEYSEKLYELYKSCAPETTTLIEYPEPHLPPTWRKSQAQLERAAKFLRRTTASKLWWAFDFDGVLCHSAKETCLSGLRAGHALLPDIFPEAILEDNDFIVQGFKEESRPLLEHGYHSIVLSYMLLSRLEDKAGANRDAVAEALAEVNDIIRTQGFGPPMAELAEAGVSEADLKTAMRAARDKWIEQDLEGWLGANEYYEIAVRAVSKLLAAGEPVYIITTKHQDYAIRLLERAGLDLPSDHVYGAGMGAKEDVINKLAGEHPDRRCFFIEDRVGTLERVAPILKCSCRLAFAQWGYNTEVDEEAARKERFEVLADQIGLADLIRAQLKA